MAEITERPKPSAKDVAKHVLRHENTALIIVLVALIAGFGVITNGLTTTRTNILNVLLQSSVRGVSSIGEAFVILSANIDLSVGGMGLFSAILGSMLMTSKLYQNLVGYPVSPLIVIPVMLLVGAAWGTLNGSLSSRVGIPSLIVTLGMWQITTGAAFNISGGRGITGIPEAVAFFGQSSIVGVPMPIIIFIIVAVIAYFVLNHTTFGRHIYAVGGNPVSAWLSGINTKNTILLVFIVSGFLSGLAAVIMLGRTMASSMRTLQGLELDSIASVCIGGISLMGGRGSLIGAIIGVLIIGVINNSLSILGAGADMVAITKGVIIITAVAIDYSRRR